MPQVAILTLGDLTSGDRAVRRPLLQIRGRRLAPVVAKHADRNRPFLVSVHSPRQPLEPYEDTVVLRREWSGRLLRKDDTVVITYLPRGGSGGGSQIGMAIAAVAITVLATVIAGPIGGELSATFFAGSYFATQILTAAVTAGGAVGADTFAAQIRGHRT